ncbi:MAG: PIG-L family deacetylase [bacterium]|nr:PIG-L family deacetylase [bacterium]
MVHEITLEKSASGKPHEGKVLVAIQAHADDIPLFCAGTIAKLLHEGYTGYLIQTTNDEKCGPTKSMGETILSNEREVDELARVLGLKSVFNLGYRNHRLDEASALELRARLIFLFRHLKVDTVFSFNPWGENEENPDHYVTGRTVEAACWMAGMGKDYPEQVAAGMVPHGVKEKYYWVVRPGQPYNRVVDIDAHLETKIDTMVVNKSQGPAGANGSRLKQRLAKEGRHLPALGNTDETADREYIRLFGLNAFREWGQAHGCEYAEAFYHIDPSFKFIGSVDQNEIQTYIETHAKPLSTSAQ